ncbi:hypothetical protein [Hymenobacter sp. IS2118]|uniref:hypothetical protein n=1 Tax=Hymenobacter sp. IS2118 TaxID=1505605 RepID=UPI00068C4F1B|nr:hypothetical protein [Hymenobacter sp. IS2118]
MSDLHNPLFDEEKEFLERKKLEYERALRGDVDDIKEKSVVFGKVALVGAGLAGGVWLITKAFGSGKKKKKKRNVSEAYESSKDREAGDDNADEQFENDNGFGAEYYTAGNGKRYKSVPFHKSAANSAQAFMDNEDRERRAAQDSESDDLGFGSTAAPQMPLAAASPALVPSAFNPEHFEDDPFKDLPYDDSRRLPTSHDFDGFDEMPEPAATARPSFVGQVLQSFLKSDTGKIIVAQAAAVVLALVTKKVSEFFPADKNPDLSDSPAVAPAETGFAPVVSPASPDFLDASTHTSAI